MCVCVCVCVRARVLNISLLSGITAPSCSKPILCVCVCVCVSVSVCVCVRSYNLYRLKRAEGDLQLKGNITNTKFSYLNYKQLVA